MVQSIQMLIQCENYGKKQSRKLMNCARDAIFEIVMIN